MAKNESEKKKTISIFEIIILGALAVGVVVIGVGACFGASLYSNTNEFNKEANEFKVITLNESLGTPKTINKLKVYDNDNDKVFYEVDIEDVTVHATKDGLEFSRPLVDTEINSLLPKEATNCKILHNTVYYSMVICQIYNDYFISHRDVYEKYVEEDYDTLINTYSVRYVNMLPGVAQSLGSELGLANYYGLYINNLEFGASSIDTNRILVKYANFYDKLSHSKKIIKLDFSVMENLNL